MRDNDFTIVENSTPIKNCYRFLLIYCYFCYLLMHSLNILCVFWLSNILNTHTKCINCNANAVLHRRKTTAKAPRWIWNCLVFLSFFMPFFSSLTLNCFCSFKSDIFFFLFSKKSLHNFRPIKINCNVCRCIELINEYIEVFFAIDVCFFIVNLL